MTPEFFHRFGGDKLGWSTWGLPRSVSTWQSAPSVPRHEREHVNVYFATWIFACLIIACLRTFIHTLTHTHIYIYVSVYVYIYICMHDIYIYIYSHIIIHFGRHAPKVPQYCGWTKSISHHFETMRNHCWFVFTRGHRCRVSWWCRILSIHNMIL